MESLVLDIGRCSIYDGPGIRTTVFLKGCPLKCEWCHNPESQSFKKQLRYYEAKCKKCGDCEKVCEKKHHHLEELKHTIDFEACVGCGKCIEACEYGALEYVGKAMTIEEVMKIVEEDKPFYKKSKGGMTLSGGEPLSHLAYSKSLLEACKKSGIHTCLETSGFARLEQVEQIMDLVDLFLLDYKVTGEMAHKKYTGVSDTAVLETLALLMSHNKKVRLRCPIIPGVNDTKEHFDGIIKLARQYPKLEGIELMPYHKLGVSKATQVGMQQNLYEEPSKEQQKEWLEYFRKEACEKVEISGLNEIK